MLSWRCHEQRTLFRTCKKCTYKINCVNWCPMLGTSEYKIKQNICKKTLQTRTLLWNNTCGFLTLKNILKFVKQLIKPFLCVFALFSRCNDFSLFCIKVGIGYWSPPIRALLRVCCGMFSGMQKVLDAPLCYRVVQL